MSIVEMRVHMCCAGCESKIRKYLQKLEGIDNVDIDMPMQKVTVTGYTDQKKVLRTVRRTGRRAELWQFPYNPEVNNYSNQYYNQQSQASSTTHYYNNTAQPSSSYNYYKHGYAGHDHGYYNQPTHTNILDERAGAMFSDENPNACSVM